MVTLNFDLNASISSASSTTVLLPIASRISSLLSVVVGMVFMMFEAFGDERDERDELDEDGSIAVEEIPGGAA